MTNHMTHTRKADAVIVEALLALGFTTPDAATILSKIRAKGKDSAIETAFTESNKVKNRRGLKCCGNICDMHLEEYIRIRMQNMKDAAGRHAILNTGGKKITRVYVYLEGLAWEAGRENGLISKKAAIAKLEAIALFRKSQTRRMAASFKSLIDAIGQLKDDTYIAERPAIYDEIQSNLWETTPAA